LSTVEEKSEASEVVWIFFPDDLTIYSPTVIFQDFPAESGPNPIMVVLMPVMLV